MTIVRCSSNEQFLGQNKTNRFVSQVLYANIFAFLNRSPS